MRLTFSLLVLLQFLVLGHYLLELVIGSKVATKVTKLLLWHGGDSCRGHTVVRLMPVCS
jgi:hypothetical protein